MAELSPENISLRRISASEYYSAAIAVAERHAEDKRQIAELLLMLGLARPGEDGTIHSLPLRDDELWWDGGTGTEEAPGSRPGASFRGGH